MSDDGARVIGLLIHAATAQVERGHFAEAYEGFNDCPYYEGDRWKLDHCNCGVREALAALDAAQQVGWFNPTVGWDSHARKKP